tara:strand:+ start:105 stop:632 length:528 start_codon:yes stop_codon:yes gene_type:complete
MEVQRNNTEILQRLGKLLLINLTIAILVITFGTFSLEFSSIISRLLPGSHQLWGSALGMITLILTIPPVFVMWKYLNRFAQELSSHLIKNETEYRANRQHRVSIVLGSILFISITFGLGFLSFPFIANLLFIGGLSIPISVAILIGSFIIASKIAVRIHSVLESAFHKTFLGQVE